VQLRKGEWLRRSELVEAVDSGELARLYLTNQRLIIEPHPTTPSEDRAVSVSAALDEIDAVQVIRQPAGSRALRVSIRGQDAPTWVATRATELATEILVACDAATARRDE
jgi:hypothetical protein